MYYQQQQQQQQQYMLQQQQGGAMSPAGMPQQGYPMPPQAQMGRQPGQH
jgi:hypothetical protein